MSRSEERASLHGLSPEEALRALLSVNPDDPESDEEHEEDESKPDED